MRDYVHVDDLAEAHVAACRYLLGGGTTDKFNIGTGVGYSVFEVVNAIGEIAGRPVPHNVSARRPGDPPVLIADPGKSRAALGFEAKHSSLENIVRTALAWHMSQEGIAA